MSFAHVSTTSGDSTHRLWHHVLAGAGAGCMTSLITCPLDVVKTRLQNQAIPSVSIPSFYRASTDGAGQSNGPKPYRGTLSTMGLQSGLKGYLGSLRRIFKDEGIRGLYRGLGPSLVGYLPSFAIYFPVYHKCKFTLSKFTRFDENHPLVHLVSAMSAGATSATATNPLWVIRTRLMTQSAYTSYRYKNSLHAIKSIIKYEGINGMYKGLGPSLLGTLHVAVQFPLYERLKSLFRTDHNADPTIRHILAASVVSKLTASIVTYPHEVLRTRLQNQTADTRAKYRGIRHAVIVIAKEEGIAGFYRGLATNVLRVVPASAVTFLSYEMFLVKFGH